MRLISDGFLITGVVVEGKLKMESFEEVKPNGGEHSQLSSRKGLITYKRKRAMPATLSLGDNASALAEEKVFYVPKHKRKGKDIGWEHGVMIGGNRFHWQCKWCGVRRNSGGVSRLKKHIAGAGDTIKCTKVPENLAKAMKEHLLHKGMLKKQTRFRQNGTNRKRLRFFLSEDSGDENPGQSDLNIQTRSGTQQSSRATQRSMTENLESEVAIHEQTMNIPHETALPSRTHNKVGNSKVNLHWRKFLENMLKHQGVSDDGVVRSCIQDALASSSFSFERNFKMNDVTDDIVQCKDESKGCFAVQGQCQRPEKSGNAEMEVSETSAHCLHTHIQTMKCSNVFREILLSEKFALLCDLLQENFQGVKLSSIFNLRLINSRMENGCYEQFPDLFDQDIQLVWEKFQKIGEEMVSLASSLSSISRTSYQKQVGEGLARENAKRKFEESYQVEQNNAIDSHRFATEFPCELYWSAKPDQTETSCKVRASTYEHYENEADGKHSITCDGCESMCHFSCSELVTDVVPIRSSYHTACSTNGCDTHEHAKTNSEQDNLLEECVVCERLEVPETLDDLIDSGRESTEFDESRESSISRTEPAEQQQIPMVAISRLCKRCGTCEETDKGLLVCGNQLCPYKFYHIRCLKGSERAIQKQSLGCWYCPSCLCRVCLSDKDDDMIIMCDGCDEAYHTYCMMPPCSAIPRGKWYCFSCSVGKPRHGMRKYGQKILLQHGKKDLMKTTEENQSMDMLLRAAEKLSSEETLAAGREDQ